MEKCAHVSKIRPAWDHSILNPEKWMCYVCRTTESVWACLSCSNVACGRFNEKHALKHYQESKHAISVEVNDKYVYCYVCDDYVLNDNAAGDIKLLRSALSAIATQKFTDIESRGRRLLRSYSHAGVVHRDEADEADKVATADWHLKQRLLARVFGAWQTYTRQQKSQRSKLAGRPAISPSISTASPLPKKRTITPGVTGLRNLGNTCYMNSVLQIVSQIELFRDFFLKMSYGFDASPNGSPQVKHVAPHDASPSGSPQVKHVAPRAAARTPPRASSRLYMRQTTVECFQHLMSSKDGGSPQKKKLSGGLNGGSTKSTPVKHQLICDVESQGKDNVSLCGELHGLFRVLWSGKWAQVSPHAFLRAVWQAIPQFKGYAQHDAQEFLCELLDKVQQELDATRKLAGSHPPSPQSKLSTSKHLPSQLLTDLFQGQLVSLVTCESCGNESRTFEPYMDLSLEFPKRYQITKQNSRVAEDNCHITEMLAKFTEEEKLEGNIYACEKCNHNRRKSQGTVYTGAKKQLLINKLPPVLRLHLKRFRWSGRMHREKISTHVAPDEILDLAPFCSPNVGSIHHYQLFGVIIHHGRGFGSGHYTAYTWNDEADSWVNCNDSRMILSALEDVLTAQAYILFYRATTPPSLPSSASRGVESNSDSLPYSLKSEDTVCVSDWDEDKKSTGASSSTSSSQKYPTMSCDLSMSSLLSMQTFGDSKNMPDVAKLSTPKYALKADGTEILLLGNSVLSSEDSVKFVDGEVSFNFKNSAEANDRKSSLRSKRSLSTDSTDSPSSSLKRPKKLSFGTTSFYSSPNGKTSQNNGTYKTETVDKSSSSAAATRHPAARKCKTRRSAPTRLNSTKVAKLNKILERENMKSLEKIPQKHVKRRKSTFW